MKEMRLEEEGWIELFPYGITFDLKGFASPQRPVIFFKDKEEVQVLPVWLSPLDAGIALAQQEKQEVPNRPYHLAWKILKSLGLKLDRCLFIEIKDHHLYVELHFSGVEELKKMTIRADEAISFCLSTETKFYCKSEFIDQCRVVDSGMLGYQLNQGKSLESMDRPTYLN